ncbi:MAG TPA: hypothetical protein VJ904_08190, partial [Tichowtungia sp.]|nr:hypothetical protein [Tichowtungia sp.]
LTGIFLPVILMPDAATAAIGWHAAFGRHARTGKKDDFPVLFRIDGIHVSAPPLQIRLDCEKAGWFFSNGFHADKGRQHGKADF